MNKQIMIDGCEFQSQCIEYKDMYSNKHIKCPIVDFAIACRGENKCKYKTVYEQLQTKEQVCEKLKKILKDKTDEYNKLAVNYDAYVSMANEQLDQLKAENNEYKKANDCILTTLNVIAEGNIKLRKTLAETKKVLQFYKNTTIGVDKGNGVFELEVSNDNIGKLIYHYDTRPAKEALQKISECEVEDEN